MLCVECLGVLMRRWEKEIKDTKLIITTSANKDGSFAKRQPGIASLL